MDSWQELITTHPRNVSVSYLSKITGTAEAALQEDLSEFQADKLASTFLFEPILALNLVRLLENDSVWIKPLCDIFRVITLLIEKYPNSIQKYLLEINVACEVSSSTRVTSAAVQCQAAAVRAGLRVQIRGVVTALREEKAARAARAFLIGTVCEVHPETVTEPAEVMGALLQVITSSDTSEAVCSAGIHSIGALVQCGQQWPIDQITQLHRLLARHVNCKWCDKDVLRVVEKCASILAPVAYHNASLRTRLWTQNGARAAVALYTAILTLKHQSSILSQRHDTAGLGRSNGSSLSQDSFTESMVSPVLSCENGTPMEFFDSAALSQDGSSQRHGARLSGKDSLLNLRRDDSTVLSGADALILQEVKARLRSKRVFLRGAARRILVTGGRMGLGGLGGNGGVGEKGAEEASLELRLVAGCPLQGELADAVWWSTTSGSNTSESLLDACVVYHHLIPAETCRKLMIRALLTASKEHLLRRIDLLVWDSCTDGNALQRHLSMCRQLLATECVQNGVKIGDFSRPTEVFFEALCDRALTTVELYVDCLDDCQKYVAQQIISRALALLAMLADLTRGSVRLGERAITILKAILGRSGDNARGLHNSATNLLQQMENFKEDTRNPLEPGTLRGEGECPLSYESVLPRGEYLLPALEARIRLLPVTRYCERQKENIAGCIKWELSGQRTDDVTLHNLLDSKWRTYVSNTPLERIAMVVCSLALVGAVTKDVVQWVGSFMSNNDTDLRYCAALTAVWPVGGLTDDMVTTVSTRIASSLPVRGAECAEGGAGALLALLVAVGGPPCDAMLQTLVAFAAGAIDSGWWEGAFTIAARRAIAGALVFHENVGIDGTKIVAEENTVRDENMSKDEKIVQDEKMVRHDKDASIDKVSSNENPVASLLGETYERVRLASRPDAAFTRLLDPMMRHATEAARARFLAASLHALAGDVRAVNARLERTTLALRVLYVLLDTLSVELISEQTWSELRGVCALCVAILRKPDSDNKERLCIQRLAYCVVCKCLVKRRAGERAARGVCDARVWNALEPPEKRPSDARTEHRSVRVRPSSRAHAPRSSFTLPPVEHSHLHDLFIELSTDDHNMAHEQAKLDLEPHVLATAEIILHLSTISRIEDNPQWLTEIKQTLEKATTPIKEMIAHAICHIATHLVPYCSQLLPKLATLATEATNELLVHIIEACIQWAGATSKLHMQDMPVSNDNMPDLGMNMQVASRHISISSSNMPVSGMTMPVLTGHIPDSGMNVPDSSVKMPVSSVHMPVSSVQMPVSSVQMSVSSVQMPVSSVQMPVSSVQMPVSSVQMPVSSVHMPVSSVQMPVSSVQVPDSSMHMQIPHMQAICKRLVAVICQAFDEKRLCLLDLLAWLLVLVPDLASEDLLGPLFDDASTRGDTWRVLWSRGVSSARLVTSLLTRLSSYHHAPYRKQIAQLLSLALRAGSYSQATAALSEVVARLRADSVADWLAVLAILPRVDGNCYRQVTSLRRRVCADARALCDDAIQSHL